MRFPVGSDRRRWRLARAQEAFRFVTHVLHTLLLAQEEAQSRFSEDALLADANAPSG
jgi:hypothetical protein